MMEHDDHGAGGVRATGEPLPRVCGMAAPSREGWSEHAGGRGESRRKMGGADAWGTLLPTGVTPPYF